MTGSTSGRGKFHPPHPGGQEGPAPSVIDGASRDRHPQGSPHPAHPRAQRDGDTRPTVISLAAATSDPAVTLRSRQAGGEGHRKHTERKPSLPPSDVPCARSESENPPGKEKQECHLPREDRQASLHVFEEKKTALHPVHPFKYTTAAHSPFCSKTPQIGLARNPATTPEREERDAERARRSHGRKQNRPEGLDRGEVGGTNDRHFLPSRRECCVVTPPSTRDPAR